MCLAYITKRYKTPTKKVQWAYKEFLTTTRGNLIFPVRRHNGRKTARRGAWLKVTKKTPIGFDKYLPGFHCFTSYRKDLMHFGDVCLKVKVRGIVVRGRQCQRPALVVRELFIPEEKTK